MTLASYNIIPCYEKEIIPCYKAGEERKQTDKACEGCSLHQWRDVHPTPRAHPETARSLRTESNRNPHRRKTENPLKKQRQGSTPDRG